MPEKAKRYASEFKDQAARKVVDNLLTVASVAREIGVSGSTLAFWVKDYRKRLARQSLAQGILGEARIRELERRNRELEAENDFLKKETVYRGARMRVAKCR